MPRPPSVARAVVVVAGLAVLWGSGARTIGQGRADPEQARIAQGAASLYDTSVLHRIQIVIAPEDAARIHLRTADRVRSTFTIDGRTLENVGVRQSGGIYHAYVPITGKPSLSVKFDEFTKGQTVFGLDKLILKNELQDVGLVSEHLAYQIFRNAGLAAPLTAHAQVTINGIDSGIYLMREPIDKSFLVRNFGKGFEDGDLYEIENLRDFAYEPQHTPLDDEGKKGRTRQSVVDFAAAIRGASAATVADTLSTHVDLDRLITFVAAETATGHWDGFTYNNNNSYLYRHPRDNRFVLLPWGLDQGFFQERLRSRGVRSSLVQKVFESPAFVARFESELARIRSEPVWNRRQLLERYDQVGRILETADPSGRAQADVWRYRNFRPVVETVIGAR